MSSLDLNPASDDAHGPELSPLGQIGQGGRDPNTYEGDAALLSQTVTEMTGDTRTAVPYAEMSHGGQPGESTKTPYDEYRHIGRQ